MLRYRSQAVLVVLLLSWSCMESNPQPSPATTKDTTVPSLDSWSAGMDVAGEEDGLAITDVISEMVPADLTTDDAADIASPDDGAEVVDISLPTPETEVYIQPECFHAPYLVGAGARIPIAVMGFSTQCAQYQHAEVTVEGASVHVNLVGLELDDPCPPCIFEVFGVLWIDGLGPGFYQIEVGEGLGAQTILVSTGDIVGPDCDGGCGPALTGQWSLVHQGPAVEPKVDCGGYGNMSSPFDMTGDCSTYAVTCPEWDGPPDITFCNDTQVFFDPQPQYETTATLCQHQQDWGPENEQWLLGLTLGDQPESANVFVVRNW